jgi:hypothetical protein
MTWKIVISFEEWRKRNPDLENLVDCPRCFGFGATVEDHVELHSCIRCEGEGLIEDLYSLYLDDIEHDLRLVFAVYPPNKMTPGLKEFLLRFYVDGVYP